MTHSICLLSICLSGLQQPHEPPCTLQQRLISAPYVHLSPSITLASAPQSSSSRTTALWPSTAANVSAIHPSSVLRVGVRRRARAAAALPPRGPFTAAEISAVHPSSCFALTSVPYSKSGRPTASWPPAAALINAVLPSSSFTLTSAPCSNNIRTINPAIKQDRVRQAFEGGSTPKPPNKFCSSEGNKST
jgi:hypothetical protein